MDGRIRLPASCGTLNVTWEVASVTVTVSLVELVVNGATRESVAAGPDRAVGTWSAPVPRSTWIALLVRSHCPDKPEIVAAHSSPADAVTILDQIEGSRAHLDTVGTRAETGVYKRMRLAGPLPRAYAERGPWGAPRSVPAVSSSSSLEPYSQDRVWAAADVSYAAEARIPFPCPVGPLRQRVIVEMD